MKKQGRTGKRGQPRYGTVSTKMPKDTFYTQILERPISFIPKPEQLKKAGGATS